MSYRSVFKPDLFAGQTVIVTGGGSGIGRCTAHEIAALGAHVVITGRKAEKLAAVKEEIETAGGLALPSMNTTPWSVLNFTVLPKDDFFAAPSFIFAVISCKVIWRVPPAGSAVGAYLTFT